MNLTPIILSLAAGIALYAGGSHMLIGFSRRPRDLTNIVFGLMALALAGHMLAVLMIHTATSVEQYVTTFKFGFGPLSFLILGAFIWFVALYTDVVPRFFLITLTAWLIVIAVLEVALPFGILFADVNALRPIILPWGEKIVVANTVAHPWRIIVDLFLMAMFGFMFYATYRHYRAGARKQALLLALAMIIIFAASGFDTLVDLGVVDSLYLTEFAFLTVIIAMSISLSLDITRTEAELQRYQTQLENMVDERTEELRAANQQLAVEAAAEERNRIARDLHDSVTQTMYSISIVAAALPRLLDRNLEEAKRSADHLRNMTLGALAEMRTLLFELRPSALNAAQLGTLVQQSSDVLTGRTQIPVDVLIEGNFDPPADVKLAFYRIAQEAFNNIAKHAQASQVSATLQSDEQTIVLRIVDDGCGFDPATVSAEHLGIRIMHERAKGIGGAVRINSTPDAGTEVEIIWSDDDSATA